MTIGAESIGGYPVTSTTRNIHVSDDSYVDATGGQGDAVLGHVLTATVVNVSATGLVGLISTGHVLSALGGLASYTGLVGSNVVGVALSASSAAVLTQGDDGSVVSGVSLIGLQSGLSVDALAASLQFGSILTAAASTVTVTAFASTVTYAIAERPTQVQYFDLVNIALDDVLGTPVVFIRNGVTYPETVGTFTDSSEVIGFEGDVITTAPQVVVRRESMPLKSEPCEGDVVSIHNQSFIVYDWRRDDSDAYLLMLKGYY